VDHYVSNARELRKALTDAKGNGTDDVIFLAEGHYLGDFYYGSDETNSLMLRAELGATSERVVVGSAAAGGRMTLASSTNSALTLSGLTFLRNCGSPTNAVLLLSTGTGDAGELRVENCTFVSPSNTVGGGLEILSARNATVSHSEVSGVANSLGRGIAIQGVRGAVTIEDCRVGTNHINASGAGLWCSLDSAAIVTVTRSSFTGNSALDRGGGAYCSAGKVILLDNSFIGNSAGEAGGGAQCASDGGSVTLSGNTLAANRAVRGGGLWFNGGMESVTLSNNTFADNEGGGASCFSYYGSVTLLTNTFTGNEGGGVDCGTAFEPLTLSGNTFQRNSAAVEGGGIRCFGRGPMTLIGNTIRNNTARQDGGGIHAGAAGNLRIVNNLIAGNRQTDASFKGGGIFIVAHANLQVWNNTIVDNVAAGSGGGLALKADGVSGLLSVCNNIIWGNTAGAADSNIHLSGNGQRTEFRCNNTQGALGTSDFVGDNQDFDPQFVDPINGDYHLTSTSPCINAGTDLTLLPAADLDGGERNVAGTVDLGCFEFSEAAVE
jgi:hypothetical protein